MRKDPVLLRHLHGSNRQASHWAENVPEMGTRNRSGGVGDRDRDCDVGHSGNSVYCVQMCIVRVNVTGRRGLLIDVAVVIVQY